MIPLSTIQKDILNDFKNCLLKQLIIDQALASRLLNLVENYQANPTKMAVIDEAKKHLAPLSDYNNGSNPVINHLVNTFQAILVITFEALNKGDFEQILINSIEILQVFKSVKSKFSNIKSFDYLCEFGSESSNEEIKFNNSIERIFNEIITTIFNNYFKNTASLKESIDINYQLVEINQIIEFLDTIEDLQESLPPLKNLILKKISQCYLEKCLLLAMNASHTPTSNIVDLKKNIFFSNNSTSANKTINRQVFLTLKKLSSIEDEDSKKYIQEFLLIWADQFKMDPLYFNTLIANFLSIQFTQLERADSSNEDPTIDDRIKTPNAKSISEIIKKNLVATKPSDHTAMLLMTLISALSYNFNFYSYQLAYLLLHFPNVAKKYNLQIIHYNSPRKEAIRLVEILLTESSKEETLVAFEGLIYFGFFLYNSTSEGFINRLYYRPITLLEKISENKLTIQKINAYKLLYEFACKIKKAQQLFLISDPIKNLYKFKFFLSIKQEEILDLYLHAKELLALCDTAQKQLDKDVSNCLEKAKSYLDSENIKDPLKAMVLTKLNEFSLATKSTLKIDESTKFNIKNINIPYFNLLNSFLSKNLTQSDLTKLCNQLVKIDLDPDYNFKFYQKLIDTYTKVCATISTPFDTYCLSLLVRVGITLGMNVDRLSFPSEVDAIYCQLFVPLDHLAQIYSSQQKLTEENIPADLNDILITRFQELAGLIENIYKNNDYLKESIALFGKHLSLIDMIASFIEFTAPNNPERKSLLLGLYRKLVPIDHKKFLILPNINKYNLPKDNALKEAVIELKTLLASLNTKNQSYIDFKNKLVTLIASFPKDKAEFSTDYMTLEICYKHLFLIDNYYHHFNNLLFYFYGTYLQDFTDIEKISFEQIYDIFSAMSKDEIKAKIQLFINCADKLLPSNQASLFQVATDPLANWLREKLYNLANNIYELADSEEVFFKTIFITQDILERLNITMNTNFANANANPAPQSILVLQRTHALKNVLMTVFNLKLRQIQSDIEHFYQDDQPEFYSSYFVASLDEIIISVESDLKKTDYKINSDHPYNNINNYLQKLASWINTAITDNEDFEDIIASINKLIENFQIDKKTALSPTSKALNSNTSTIPENKQKIAEASIAALHTTGNFAHTNKVTSKESANEQALKLKDDSTNKELEGKSEFSKENEFGM